MADLISRQAAIDALGERPIVWTNDDDYGIGVRNQYDWDLRAIKTVPPVDAVPAVHGKWVDDKGLYRCSSCNHLWSELWWTENCPIERMLKIMPFCPNCGAKMDGGKDDETPDGRL